MTHHTPDRLLRVDLTDERVESERVPERWLRRYVGGKGLGARYLYDELDAGIDPLGPDNALLFMLGPLSGYLPGEQRYAAVTKSPLTGGFLDSYSGGRFPRTLAGALTDHIGLLVTGRADEPMRIDIEDGEATLEPADHWGADAVETDEAFPEAAVACIGPAGENRVAYATIATEGGDHHAGRGGAGAVMGAKGLKAVVARGDPPDSAALGELREKYETRIADDDTGRWQATSETLESIDFANEVGALSTRGWQDGRFEGTDDIGIEAARAASHERERADEVLPGGFRVETHEGETVPRGAAQMTLGAGLGIDDFDAVAVLGGVCDRLALDVISAGSAVAWAMRASDDAVIEREFDFGDDANARALIEEITRRETELGDALAEGVEVAAERFGNRETIPTVKRMELPAYDPRAAPSMALAYATSDRGACHRRARPIEREALTSEAWTPERTARAVIDAQDRRSMLWSLVADDFAGEVFDDFGAEWLSAVGREYTADELRTAGERIWTLTRLFNVREGFARADDALPAALSEPLRDDRGTGRTVDRSTFDTMLDAYYARRGWGTDGRPTRETLARLGLGAVRDAETPVADSADTTREEEHREERSHD
jgi:aldehyde:ferredoxin oxidoreductase